MAPKYRRKVFNMRPIAMSNFQNFDFCQMTVLGIEIRTSVQNFIENGWFATEILIKLFLKWRPSAILNLRKLLIWSCDRCLHVILHLRSKSCINRPIWRQDMANNDFHLWCPSAILNLQNFDFFLWNVHPRNGNSHSRNKLDRNQIIHRWDMDKKLFSKWRPSAILRKLPFPAKFHPHRST